MKCYSLTGGDDRVVNGNSPQSIHSEGERCSLNPGGVPVNQKLCGGKAGGGGVNVAPCHEVHLVMGLRSSRVHITLLLPHHLVVCVDKVPAPVVPPPRVQAGQVLHEAGVIVDSHQAQG